MADITKPILLDETGQGIKVAIEQLSSAMENMKGADGKTPVRGVDYFTPEDVSAIVADTKSQIAAGEQYALIESITTTEEVNELKRTVEPDGTPYNFKRLMVNIRCPAASARAGVFIFDGSGHQLGFIDGALNTSERASRFKVDVSGGYIESLCTTAGGVNNYLTATVLSYGAFRALSVLDGLRLTNATLPVGTKIDIYGVRA